MSSAARIEELQKKFDENPRRYFAPLANECRKAGDLDAAIAICRTHLPQQPGHMSGHIVYGQALFESGELDEARTVFETALGLDPENLIALRHMGDIAARHGDMAAARQWYTRVLETDPRNEEIQSLVFGLDQQAGPPGGSGAGSAAVAPSADRFGGEEQLEDVTAGAEDLPRVRGGLPTLVDPALLAVAADAMPERDVPYGDTAGGDVRYGALPQGDPTDGEAAQVGIEDGDWSASPFPEAPADPELLDLTGTGFDDAPLVTSEAEAAAAADTPRDELLEPTALEFETPDAHPGRMEGLEVTTFEAPAADDGSSYERVGDEALMDGIETPSQLEGLESAEFDASGFGGSGLETIAAPSFEFEPADAGPMQDPPAAPPAAEAFVTETMAELYLRQGYRDEALGVYRKLVSQSPHDGALRSRMERLESELSTGAGPGSPDASDAMEADGDDVIAGLPSAMEPALVAVAAEAEPEVHEATSPVAAAGPTIREFLAALATGAPLPSQQPEGEIADVVDLGDFDVTEPEGEPAPSEAIQGGDFSEDPLSPHAGKTSAGDGLDALFGAPTEADLRAADALAAAYLQQPGAPDPSAVEPLQQPVDQPVAESPGQPQAEQSDDAAIRPATQPAPGADTDPLRGRPARPAGNDLSLDHVFGAPRQQGSPRNTGGFSFDQFFAEGAVKPARDDAPDQQAATGDEEDLEQFNSWLHNLRKQ